jgi:TonB family protein
MRRGYNFHVVAHPGGIAVKCGFCSLLLASLLFTISSAQEPCPPPPPGKTASFDTCKYPFNDSSMLPLRAISVEDPQYTDSARRKKINGQVILAVALNAQGTIDDVKVVRSLDKGLDQAAIDAVKQWKFSPAIKDGKPVAAQLEVEIQFRIY